MKEVKNGVVDSKWLLVLRGSVILIISSLVNSTLAKERSLFSDKSENYLNQISRSYLNGSYSGILASYPLSKKPQDRIKLNEAIVVYWTDKPVKGFVEDVSTAIKNEKIYDLLILSSTVHSKKYADAILDHYLLTPPKSLFQNSLLVYFCQGLSGTAFLSGDLSSDFEYAKKITSLVKRLNFLGLDAQGLKYLEKIDEGVLARMMISLVKINNKHNPTTPPPVISVKE